jgi:hypothetical protein
VRSFTGREILVHLKERELLSLGNTPRLKLLPSKFAKPPPIEAAPIHEEDIRFRHE